MDVEPRDLLSKRAKTAVGPLGLVGSNPALVGNYGTLQGGENPTPGASTQPVEIPAFGLWKFKQGYRAPTIAKPASRSEACDATYFAFDLTDALTNFVSGIPSVKYMRRLLEKETETGSHMSEEVARFLRLPHPPIIKCAKCGHDNRLGDTNCNRCGEPLV